MYTFQDLIREQVGKALTEALDKQITHELAQHVADKLGIDFTKEKFTLEEFTKGMRAELEHKDVTKGDAVLTGKIALVHLKEVPNYYDLLAKYVEKKKS